MSSKLNDWKVLKIFTVSVTAAIFSAILSQAISVQASAMSELTIEERLAKVREQLQYTVEQSDYKSDSLSSRENSLETEENRTLKAQWPNYWSDWSNGPWSNGPWSDWSDWSDQPWNNWSDWSDWSDWSNYW